MGSSAPAERLCLLLADISGYTSYLQGVELDHAQDVIADLITAVVTPIRSHFRLNKLEGDAAFLYSHAEDIDGSVLLDMIEGAYFAFRRRVSSIERASSCQCGACSLIPRLDLKILIHQGTVAIQEMLGMTELVGHDVVLIHRLLKNEVEEATGTKAYALLTEAAVQAAGLEPDLLDMTPVREEIPDFGEQKGWVHDLDRAWRKEQARRRFYIDVRDSAFTLEEFIPDAPAHLVWEWLTRADRRACWEDGFDGVVDVAIEGRRGVGTETHCVHGGGAIKEEVVDWRPPRYVTYRGTFVGGEPFVVTDEVVEMEGGVLVRKNLQPASAEHRQAVLDVVAAFQPIMAGWFPRMAELIAEQLDSMGPASEPPLPKADESARLATSLP